ncbi:MAG TPA: TIGR03086 family metal-binding protein [Kineosporiaceae bacterium]|nr:TIGR03086 family metal-binding protein [Kineosporiaceae bacterium]
MTHQTTQPAAPSATPDPRPLFLHAVDQAVGLLAGVTPTELDGPTPCTDYDVRELSAHLITVLRRITHVADGGDALDIPTLSEVPDAELGAAAVADGERLKAVWSDDSVLDRPLRLPWVTLPGRAAAMAYTQEVAVHSWDLATAVGRAGSLDPALAAALEPAARQFVPESPRGGPVPFGPVVEVPADAGPYLRLVGWLGRDPQWAPAG